MLLLAQITPLADLSRVSLDLFSIHFIITLHNTVPLLQRRKHNTRKKIKIKYNKMLLVLVEKYAANEQLTVNVTSNFSQYCYNYLDW